MALLPLSLCISLCWLFAISVSAYASDIESTIAGEAFDAITGDAVSGQMKNTSIIKDLAARWYNADPTLRDTMPVKSFDGKDLNDFTEIEWNVKSNTAGVVSWRMVHPVTGELIDFNSPLFESVYEDWYNYFAGITDDGGESGGGAGSGTISSVYSLVPNYPNTFYVGDTYCTNNAIYSTNGETLISNCVLRLDSTSMENISAWNIDFETYKYIYVGATNTNTSIMIFKEPMTLTEGVVSGVTYKNKIRNDTGETQSYYSMSKTPTASIQGGTLYLDVTNIYISMNSIGNGSEVQFFSYYINDGNVSGGGSGGGNQPTEPTYPTPYQPTTPEPPTSPPDNNPTNVNIGGNTYNNNTGTTSVDLTPLLEMLRIINSNIIEFETGFNNYANKVQEYLSSIYDMVYGFLENIQDEIDDYGRLILEELREANQWLAYIFYSLGQGGGSQPDPVEKPNDWWGWLGNLADGLLGDLPTELTALTGTMQALRSVFPFSLPWDLGVLLGLFVATPVTPVLDIPFGYSANGVTYVRVDCSSWNNVMATVRSVELVAFAAGLAFKTRDLLKVVEV